MATSATGVLTPDDLNDTDDAVLDVLRTGRVTPQYAADEMGVSRTYASERLKRLVEHNHVEKVAPGLYELLDDPRDDVDQEDDVEVLRARIAELEAQIEAARGRANATLEALERVDGEDAAENARATVEALEVNDG